MQNPGTCTYGWKEGGARAAQVYTQMDLDLVEDLGAPLVSRPGVPRNYSWISAWRDGTEAKPHGEVFR